MHDDQFWQLVSLKLSGEATQEELSELKILLQENPELGLRLEILHNLWNKAPVTPQARRTDALNRHLQRLSNHLSEPVLQYETAGAVEEELVDEEPEKDRKSRLYAGFWPITGIAASLAAAFILLNPWAPKKNAAQVAQNTISTKPGSKSKIQLPDGSQVWLNADSRITYDESFRGPFREVQLTGEAYFDIARDKDHPFIIHASTIDVKVLGTSLNIRSYTNEKNTETVLIHGSIEVTLRNSPDRKIILKPNEKLVVLNGKAMVVKGGKQADDGDDDDDKPVITLKKAHFREKDSTATEVLWVKNKLAFDQESLEDVALKIERWYNVKMFITEESLKNTAYSGVFEDESLRQVMEALRLTGNFRYTINKREITITP
jgi:ferric-dicitrate binding protein FerR (iron transport regulator)